MAKETKDERTVRSMTPLLTEHMIELKNLASGSSKESDIESWCQSLLKSVLGFSASSGYVVRTQEARAKMRFDIAISKADKPEQILLLVEVKKLGADLNKSDLRSGKVQLNEYLKTVGDVRWGILTNGYEWRLYDFKSDLITVASTDIRNDQQELDVSGKGITEAAWDLIEFSANYFEGKTWEELSAEAQALSPDSLARAILSADVVKRIGKVLNGEHDYRASVDLLTDKLSELLEQGLNDLVGTWNETQKAELDRYIRNQKKQAKKTKRRGPLSADAIEGTAVTAPDSSAAATPAVAVVTDENKAA
ncbi:MAG TPA: hypothetical protein DCS07_05040 [Bdellovibrionales bacterium]|nr:MAG: hypothetical protein A2Z97_16135 [Bdellovibrionales bacterium GWB1_52_6]OFZ05049.1 MAG: hypothetical protein A2X97_00455 [Bdellovibrionales bacterium GWA1_52_35]OFZ37244.1 MAG: hypothetical protein A2070_07095 [Bdellovibrionales bacterium GWC1_52_8]HAR41986.1 hypothetical protein [Bdellovibrionales bacterium]HCM41285.1 hypothetical protein [Bdellovibrionales bacterium]